MGASIPQFFSWGRGASLDQGFPPLPSFLGIIMPNYDITKVRHQLESVEIAVTRNKKNSQLSDFWNSSIARVFVSDKISITLSTSVTAFFGVSEEVSFNWITRGHDGSPIPYITLSVGGQVGAQISADALIGISKGYFATSDMRSLQPGEASNGLLGWSMYGSADAGFGLGGSITGSLGFSGSPLVTAPTWMTGGVSVGASIGGGATGGLSYTFPVVQSQFNK